MNHPSHGAVSAEPLGIRCKVWSALMTFTVLQPVKSVEIVRAINTSLNAITLGNVFVDLFIAFYVLRLGVICRCRIAPNHPNNEWNERGDDGENGNSHDYVDLIRGFAVEFAADGGLILANKSSPQKSHL